VPISIKRIYDPPSAEDGYRVLVDRLWPRGLTREAAAIDEWLREIAPSDALRRWFDHRPELWPEFKARFAHELATDENRVRLAKLSQRAASGVLTLLHASRETRFNNAVAIREMLEAGGA